MGILFVGCEAGAPHLGSLPEGDQLSSSQVTSSRRRYRNGARLAAFHAVAGSNRERARPRLCNVQIWEDGTVLFDGGGCPHGSRRRGKMSPARVGAVIDKLEEAQFFMWSCEEEVPCSDSFITSLTVTRRHVNKTVVDTGCESKRTLAAQAIELVMQAVGKNACNPSCLATPAAAYCR